MFYDEPIEIATDVVNVTVHIHKFRDFLNASWPSVKDILDHAIVELNTADFIAKWVQGNWEYLVDWELLQDEYEIGYLSPFIFPQRLTSSDAEVTHKIVVKLDPSQKIVPGFFEEDAVIESMGTFFENGTFQVSFPFDHVIVKQGNGNRTILPFSECQFYIKPDLNTEMKDINKVRFYKKTQDLKEKIFDPHSLDITDHIHRFRSFMNACCPHLDNIMEHHDWHDSIFMEMWDQFNWEFLVEKILLPPGQFLFPFFYHNSRVTCPGANSSFIILVKVNEDFHLVYSGRKETYYYEQEDLRLKNFATYLNTKYGNFSFRPPFDYAAVKSLQNHKVFTVPLDQCRFFLNKYPEND